MPKTLRSAQRKKWLSILQKSVAKKSRGAKTSINIVVDSSVWVSAIYFGGIPEKAVAYCLDNSTIVTSTETVDELYNYFRNVAKVPHKWLRLFIAALQDVSVLINTETESISEAQPIRDPNDTHILVAAIKGKCKIILTGDNDLLSLDNYQGILILKPADFLELIKETR